MLTMFTVTFSTALAEWQTGLLSVLQYSYTALHFDPDHRQDTGHGILRDTAVASEWIR
jgi:hypothetical protein